MRFIASLLVLTASICLLSRCALGQDEWTFSWHSSEVTDLAFTPDGTKLVSTSLTGDRISRMTSGNQPDQPIGSKVGEITGKRSHAVAISPDGSQVAIAGFNVTTMYDLKTQNQQWQIDTSDIYKSPPTVKALAFSPDGKRLATSGNWHFGGRITIRNADTGNEIHRFGGWWHQPGGLVSFADSGIAFSPDGKLFASGSFGRDSGEGPKPGELRVWDAEKGKLLSVCMTKDSVQDGQDNAAIHGIAFSADSRLIAIACSDGVIRLWNTETATVSRELTGHQKAATAVTFSPDGQLIASGGKDRSIRVWNTSFGRQITMREVESPEINAVEFSPDGRLLVAGGGDSSRSGEVRMWRISKVSGD